jgi:hypothetical protein
MTQYTRTSSCASLVIVGQWMQQRGVWNPVEDQVVIKQKTVKYRPVDKLKDAFIAIMAGGHGVVEINTRVRSDEALQRAFGRDGCADQSTVSATLNCATSETVAQLRAAQQQVYRQHSQGYRHAYEQQVQVLDIDMSGLLAGRQGEGVSKGYFSGHHNARGRQLGRVLATRYDEIVVDRLYDGKRQLNRQVRELILAAEEGLDLTPDRRAQTLLRLDRDGGSADDINWMLERGYQILTKVNHWARAQKLSHWPNEISEVQWTA